MMQTRTNGCCRACPLAHNGLNGRYCNRVGLYVEHASEPPCGKRTESEG